MQIKQHRPVTSGTRLVPDNTKMIRAHRDKPRHRRIIDQYKAEHPLCVWCLCKGTLTKMAEAHHIREVGQGGETAAEWLLSLCKGCHVAIAKVPEAEQLAIKQEGEARSWC